MITVAWRRIDPIAVPLLQSAVQAAWSPVGVLGIQPIAESDAYRGRSNPLPGTGATYRVE
jgi:hypothetical protein